MSWEPFDVDPAPAILEALIEMNAKLARLVDDVRAIRLVSGEDDEEEEEDH